MKDTEYDAVIVGSGVAGAIVAKTLTDAGKKVLLLDAGLESGMALEGDRAYQTQMAYLDKFYNAVAKAPNSPFPNLPNAPSSDVLETLPVEMMDPNKGYFVQKGPLAFGSDNWVGPGGTMQHWLGTALRMLPNDFQMQSMYGRAVDWPFNYLDLRPYYEMAEYELGVAGEVKDQQLPNIGRDYFSDGYVFPMEKIPQSYLDHQMLTKTQGLRLDIDVGNGRRLEHTIRCCSTPQGRNSFPNKQYKFNGVTWDRETRKLTMIATASTYRPVGSLWDQDIGQRCEGNASCVPICPVQAKYNALKTIKRAKVKNPHLLDIQSQSVAYELVIDRDSKKIDGVRFKRYESADKRDYTEGVARGTIYVLAASAIENAKLLLASGAANSSDQVGRNLMDHMCFLTWGTFPVPVYPFRGPGSTTNISSFRDGDFRSIYTAWICPIDNWGWGWPSFAPGADVVKAVMKGDFGPKLRQKLENDLTRQVLLHFECEQDPQPENRVTIDSKYKDRIGNYRPVIHYDASNYVKEAFRIAKLVSDQIFKENGITDRSSYTLDQAAYWEYQGKGYTSRGAGHIVGTHRLGSDPGTSVVDPDMRTWDHKNLFLAGCGNMPTLGTSNPTLTLAALAFKSAEAILQQLQG
jgi:choline dehydrogenase-like flavoprotein